ncbi:MAG: biopolymer transporter ExbD [Rhodobacterales bacterium]|nr:biopolymer transporter ExbD [Rhodobacterales bacterium]MDX5389006.1 biopolymer transporter ExbD [Rhodobacterales bacterium]MDX5488695.1 biopolymer transporter ExbD [Rhodobacterales bacterium]
MIFTIDSPRPRRKPSLTPMIDVVFLLLVFFMLASRFGQEAQMPLVLGGTGEAYSGPPRLIDVLPEGQRLNGVDRNMDDLLAALTALTASPADTVVLRARDGAELQRLVSVITALREAGFAAVAVVP